jgi:DNA polymerase III delta prime subunit
MMDQPTHEPDAFTWLTPDDQARLVAFKAYAVNHPRLDEVDMQLTQAILEPAGFAHVLVYGPSGVGKTTMLQRVATRLLGLCAHTATPLAWSPHGSPPQPLLVLEARPPDGQTFNRADYYRAALLQLGEPYYTQRSLVDINVERTWETRTQSKSKGRTVPFNDSPELRRALEEALARHGVRAVILDEGQHLMQVTSGAKLLDQLDWIKSMTNVTGVVHVLVGTYDLLDFRNLNGQAARRGYDLHFPRYRLQSDADRQAFQGALHSLLLQIPLALELQDLMNHWHYFYERSIGCVGVLKDWLVRTVASTLRVQGETLTLARLQAHALSNAQCESMAMDAHAAEQKLQFTESSREHLWSLLGMSTLGPAERPAAPGAHQPQAAGAASRATRAPKTRRVGERAPTRDAVGTTPPAMPAMRCSFAGVTGLQPDQIARTAVAKVECPDCGAMRTLHPQGQTVTFPAHAKRLTSTPRKDARWIRHGTTWELSHKQG